MPSLWQQQPLQLHAHLSSSIKCVSCLHSSSNAACSRSAASLRAEPSACAFSLAAWASLAAVMVSVGTQGQPMMDATAEGGDREQQVGNQLCVGNQLQVTYNRWGLLLCILLILLNSEPFD